MPAQSSTGDVFAFPLLNDLLAAFVFKQFLEMSQTAAHDHLAVLLVLNRFVGFELRCLRELTAAARFEMLFGLTSFDGRFLIPSPHPFLDAFLFRPDRFVFTVFPQLLTDSMLVLPIRLVLGHGGLVVMLQSFSKLGQLLLLDPTFDPLHVLPQFDLQMLLFYR